MARFLLLARSTGRSARVKGDPVAVFDDSHIFGEREDKSIWLANGNAETAWPGIFFVLDVLGITLEEAKRMIQVHKRAATAGDDEFDAPDAADRFVILGRHRWNFDIGGKLTVKERRDITNKGILRLTKKKLNSYTVDRSGLGDSLITASPRDI